MKRFIGAMLFPSLLLIGCVSEKPREGPKPDSSVVQQKAEAPVEKPAETSPPAVSGETTNKEQPKALAEPKAKPAVERNVTIAGDVVDIVSYATTGVMANSPAGKEIIEAGSKGGNPLGIRDRRTGDVYIVTMKKANTSANATLLPFVGVPVTAKGDVYRKGDQRLLVMSVVGKSAK